MNDSTKDKATPNLSVEEDNNFEKNLYNLRKNNINRVIFEHININSIRNKFDLLMNGVKNSVDILVISETKLDESFPPSQFQLDGGIHRTGWIGIAMEEG